MTIVGVMLSTALICTVVGMVATFRQSIIQDYKENSGDWHVCIGVSSAEQYDTALNNAHVEKAGVSQQLGFSEMGERYGYMRYLNIYGCNDAFFTQMNIKPKEGRLPENASEMLISSAYAETENAPKVGDMVTLPVGDRVIRTEDGEELQYNGWDYAEEEVFIPAGEKTYTIVGIADGTGSHSPYSGFVAEDEFKGKYTQIYIRFDKPSRYTEILDGLTNALSGVDDGSYDYMTNMLVRYEGGLSDAGMNMAVGLALIISVIIVGTSVFIISNSFRISVEDKKTQFGMLASVGATKRQIRAMVFREGLYIFVIGTAAGLALGAFVIWLLDQVVNLLIGDMMSIRMVYTFPLWVAVFTVLLSAVTIFLSALKPARYAARITPIEIIRGGSDIRIDADRPGAKRMTSKLFGVGGVIARKNYRRSKRKYRTTIVSLVIAAAVFIAISGFVSYGKKLVGEVYTKYDSNLVINYIGDQYEDGFENVKKAYDRVRSLSGIKSSFYGLVTEGFASLWPYGSEERKEHESAYAEQNSNPENLDRAMLELPHVDFQIIMVPEQIFTDHLKKLGITPEDPDNAALLADREKYYENDVKYTRRNTSLDEGDILRFVYAGDVKDGDDSEEPEPVWMESSCRIEKLVDEETLPTGLGGIFMSEGGTFLLISEKHFSDTPANAWMSALYVDAEEPGVTGDTVEAWNNGEQPVYRINNLYEQQQGNERMILVLGIFLYGFIIVITLIAVTNVINTINTNMNLRRREFAMLQSIGMTGREFSGMIRAEGLLVSLKAILFGIPLGAVLSYLVHLVVKKRFSYEYVFPWVAMIVASAAVVVIVGVIMWSSVRRIRKQNIIDAIRARNY